MYPKALYCNVGLSLGHIPNVRRNNSKRLVILFNWVFTLIFILDVDGLMLTVDYVVSRQMLEI